MELVQPHLKELKLFISAKCIGYIWNVAAIGLSDFVLTRIEAEPNYVIPFKATETIRTLLS